MRLWSLALCAVGMWPFTATTAGEGPFRDLSFKEACAAAETREKIVLIDFYTTWCGPCKLLDQTTWKDDKVRRWLRNRTIALKIDAEKEKKLTEKYRVKAYPTILLLKPDGTEIDRLVGYREAEAFLQEAKDALAGKDSVSRAKEQLKGDKKNDPQARMNHARTLAQRGKSKEALREYLWCFDHGNQHSIGFHGVRLSFLLSDIVSLGEDYPPAIEALEKRREAAEEKLLAGLDGKPTKDRRKQGLLARLTQPSLPAGFEQAMEVAAINRSLGCNERTLELYDRLIREGSRTAMIRRVMLREVIDLMLAAKRYDDVLAETGDPFKEIDSLMGTYRMVAAMDRDKPKPYNPSDSFKQHVAVEGSKYYEAMLGAGQKATARRMARKLITFNNRGDTYAVLIERAMKVGADDEAQRLVRRAKLSLPEEELPKVRQAAAKIAKSQVAREGEEGAD